MHLSATSTAAAMSAPQDPEPTPLKGVVIPLSPDRAVKPDYTRDALLSEFAKATMRDRYLLPDEQSPQDAFLRVALAFGDNALHSARLYDYFSRLWAMPSTPILSNGGTKRGLPISCFMNYVGDSRGGLTDHYAENAWLSSVGGGVGGYWGDIRSNGTHTKHGSQSSGVIPFMKVVDAEVLAFAQGVTRRASYAAYLDISHPEILEFLDIRKPTGGDANRKCLNLHHAVNIPDAFMEIVERCMRDETADDSWPLVDPHSKRVVTTASARDIWQRILDLRMQTGEPYLVFIDAANRALPDVLKQQGLKIHHSNLCTEIMLPTTEQRTAVCCLSSLNLEKFDEWKDHPWFIEDMVRMLDNVLEFFILQGGKLKHTDAQVYERFVEDVLDEIVPLTPTQKDQAQVALVDTFSKALKKAVFSARQERSIGLGAMGFHSYLQRQGIPFESALATSANRRMFAHIKSKAEEASVRLAYERGPCPDAEAGGVMRRNLHLLAVAPNASTSIFPGVSPGIEPNRANAYTHKTDSGSWLVKNPYLLGLLEQLGRNTEEVWQSITVNRGSVQHLDFLSDDEKAVFKTALELDQRWVVEHAAHRQPFICQGQSVNLFMPADVSIPYLHHVHFMAWKQGLKSLYYMRSEAIRRADVVSNVMVLQPVLAESASLVFADAEACLSCEG